jgi:hypothetical protein
MQIDCSSTMLRCRGDRLNILFVTSRFPPFMGGIEPTASKWGAGWLQTVTQSVSSPATRPENSHARKPSSE